jgi:hypothetical protein
MLVGRSLTRTTGTKAFVSHPVDVSRQAPIDSLIQVDDYHGLALVPIADTYSPQKVSNSGSTTLPSVVKISVFIPFKMFVPHVEFTPTTLIEPAPVTHANAPNATIEQDIATITTQNVENWIVPTKVSFPPKSQ